MVELIAGVECQRRFSPRGRVEYSYDVELYASAKMFASIISVRSFEASFGASAFVTLIQETNA
jgi:hydroxyacyl-ACP dehydratase HTD2-like protein with hotdog domain